MGTDKHFKRVSHRRTICEVLRELNDNFQENSDHDKDVRKRLLEIMVMAKRMQYKLLDYNKKGNRDWWAENKNYEKALKKRMRKSYLVAE